MKVVSVLVLGDIHYPKTRSDSRVHIKMNATAPRVKDGLKISALSLIMEDIQKQLNRTPIDAILITGDFTDAGDVSGFQDCLSYINSTLSSRGTPIVGVPGNHDLTNPEKLTENPKKFDVFSTSADAHKGVIDLSFDGFRDASSALPCRSIGLFALNSCGGCAELWETEPGKSVMHLISQTAAQQNEKAYEKFDSPFIPTEALTRALSKLDKPHVKLGIVLAHHNVLPAKYPRVVLFPELLNGGFVRDRLASFGKPVIYIHGHIHERAVDFLNDPTRPKQLGLVAVSAPLLTDGYLIVRLVLGEDDQPLSVHILHRRFESNRIESGPPITSQFFGDKISRTLLTKRAKKMLQAVQNSGSVRYGDIVKKQGDRDLFVALECMEMISVSRDVEDVVQTWRVRAS